jgi:hypothetical protein
MSVYGPQPKSFDVRYSGAIRGLTELTRTSIFGRDRPITSFEGMNCCGAQPLHRCDSRTALMLCTSSTMHWSLPARPALSLWLWLHGARERKITCLSCGGPLAGREGAHPQIFPCGHTWRKATPYEVGVARHLQSAGMVTLSEVPSFPKDLDLKPRKEAGLSSLTSVSRWAGIWIKRCAIILAVPGALSWLAPSQRGRHAKP